MRRVIAEGWKWTALVLLGLGFISIGGDAFGQESSGLHLRAFLARSNSGADHTVVVSLINKREESIHKVVVEVWANKRLKRGSIDEIRGLNSSVMKLSVPTDDKSLYVVARFGNGESIAEPVASPPIAEGASNPNWIAILTPATLGLIGVLVGAILGHILSSRRELTRAKFDLTKMYYEKTQEAYSEFLAGWAGSTSPQRLEGQFSRLISLCHVPPNVHESYRKTIEALRSSAAGDEKEKAVERLQSQIGEMMAAPWKSKRVGLLSKIMRQ
ncbi:hypothetical protein [Streptomyces cellulosae]|uniref:hypothetical protein n=1 Tax=Streptomyces cellulosae TaxID=1968 RepID=UPI00131ADE9C|nr:hypothetical protein [Streptomyces cellulosae]